MKLYVLDKQSQDCSREDKSKSVLNAERQLKCSRSLMTFDISNVVKNFRKEKLVEQNNHKNTAYDYA